MRQFERGCGSWRNKSVPACRANAQSPRHSQGSPSASERRRTTAFAPTPTTLLLLCFWRKRTYPPSFPFKLSSARSCFPSYSTSRSLPLPRPSTPRVRGLASVLIGYTSVRNRKLHDDNASCSTTLCNPLGRLQHQRFTLLPHIVVRCFSFCALSLHKWADPNYRNTRVLVRGQNYKYFEKNLFWR